ncbi:family 10 glycosylhydrolase [Paenibacillus spongiae]|uniref:Family 10 glycosylhydrolase n=1 Tax=Paenibacillus spongiae TaxID=2909671 RepID=A0ABY5S4U3_9BACL|nr:family 10 glycosylhydrolase [Paenibacillus spongiae]UVI28912.1 family 10 glycosylhydrolase [Paenibacillus spongiae]
MKFGKWLAQLMLLAVFVAAAIPAGAGKAEAAVSSGSADIAIYLDGEKLNSDVSPYVIPKQYVTMVPLRVISEGLGAGVDWNQQTKTVTISNASTTITMTTGRSYAVVNGSNVALDASVQARAGRTMVPLRFVGEQLGLLVNWEPKTNIITLLTVNNVPVNPGTGGGSGNGETLNGVWVSTVYNLDWPTAGSYGKSDQQREEFITLLDELQGIGLNAVFVQVRPAGDALYPSALVPWSKFLTGTQGKAPDYDPLAFMIEETHKRGMEFHAWFNPFRASVDAKTDTLAANHVSKLHPEWIVSSGGKPYINPGIPEARQHIIDTIMEVVNGYDIDGVHLDDYFYPSSGAFPDEAAFNAYNPNGLTIGDWRRDNINSFVQQLGESIHSVNPNIRFGISPFGVWRNQSVDATGSDTKAGVTAYDNMYADVRTWIKQGWIDYVTPQIYWSLSFSAARYDKLVDWWVQEVRGTGVDLYIGHSPYKLGTTEAGWQSSQEIINQLMYNKKYPEIKGDVFFSAKDLRRNPLGIIEALRTFYLSIL